MMDSFIYSISFLSRVRVKANVFGSDNSSVTDLRSLYLYAGQHCDDVAIIDAMMLLPQLQELTLNTMSILCLLLLLQPTRQNHPL